MNVSSIVNKTIKLVTPSMHATRRNALLCCINSLLQGNAATVTSIGRGIDSDTTDKHSIKRADRLCSNNYLLAETEGVYGAICELFCQNSSRPIILVDWSDLDESKRHFLIRASLAFDGRSITLYEEIHELNTKEKPATHAAFLAKLKEKLGVDVKPIIVTDAGFKTPWFREVLALQWDFLGRTRLPNFYKLNNQKTWKSISHFYKQAGTKPKARSGAINQSNPLDCRLIIYKQESQGRQDLNRYGEARKSTNAKKYAKGANDPWLLSTSLKMTNTLGKKAVSIYRKRMQIEEEFRDMKSSTYGLGFEQSRTRILHRLTILILMITLASLVLLLIALSVVQINAHRRYQANTSTKRVLSFQFVARRAIQDRRLMLSASCFKDSLLEISEQVFSMTKNLA